MLAIVLNWVYIILTTLCLGFGFIYLIEKLFHYRVKRLDSILAAGLILVTVFAQIFSLFYKVGLAANLVLSAVCICILLTLGRRIWADLRLLWRGCSLARKVVAFILFFFWAYCTSRGYMHYDSDLYHAQSIRWIEEFGVVKGLGNLHERFAYNSSVFALTALYSMKFLTGRSLHTLSGYFALLLSMTILDIGGCWKRKRLFWSDYARIAGIYYLTTIMEEVVAPASDYAIMCMILYIIIKWLSILEEKESEITPYALLCVAGVYALTIKLTAGLILVLLIKPAYLLLRKKRWKQIGLYLGMGLAVALPWIIRTVIISGWLLYPFPRLDLFSVDWKMDASLITVDAAQIMTWGRALYNGALVDLPLSQWFPNWFKTTLSATEKLLIIADLCSIVLICMIALWTLLKKKWQNGDKLLVLSAIACSYAFWQYSAPLMRYGYAYVLLLPALVGGWMLLAIGRDRIAFVLILLYGLYKLYITADYVYDTAPNNAYLWQQDYGTYQLRQYELGGVTFYVPVSGDRTGYEYFPAAPTEGQFELRGNDLKDGFRPKH